MNQELSCDAFFSVFRPDHQAGGVSNVFIKPNSVEVLPLADVFRPDEVPLVVVAIAKVVTDKSDVSFNSPADSTMIRHGVNTAQTFESVVV